MNYYELTYLALPSLTEEKIQTLEKNIQELVKDQKFEKKEKPTKITLAYEINKEQQAFLVSLCFYSLAENVAKIKDYLKEEKNILRHLVLKTKPQVEEKRRKRERKNVLSPHTSDKSSKVELSDIDKKIEEILQN